MSKVLTFSRTFPSYHPRKGEPTLFVEAILTQRGIDYTNHDYFVWLVENNPKIDAWFLKDFYLSLSYNIDPKSHTIRAHKKPLKVGQWINPNCWAGVPYHKTKDGFWQIKFAPDIEVKNVWDFELTFDDLFYINKSLYAYSSSNEALDILAGNDGLSQIDLLNWFNKPFTGQIIAWNENINY